MKSQEQLILEEQRALEEVISKLDSAMLDENHSLTYSQLQKKKAKDKCLPDTYGDLVKALNDEQKSLRELKRIKNIKDKLYDTHLVVESKEANARSGEEEAEQLDLKVGLHTYFRGKEIIVISWVRPICRHYLLDNSSEEYTSVVVDPKDGREYVYFYKLKLNRKVDIFFDKVKKVSHLYPVDTEEYEKVIADEFLQELLSRRSEKEFRNIVFSIQKRQGEIIQTPFLQNMIVQGCAGSGKSMIMLHRLPILLYDNPDILGRNSVYVITPSITYIQMAENMMLQLEISDLKMGTLEEYYNHLIEKYIKPSSRNSTINSKHARALPSVEKYVYSDTCIEDIREILEKEIGSEPVNYYIGKTMLEIEDADWFKKENKTASDRLQSELLNIQTLLNRNSENLRTCYKAVVSLVAQLQSVERMLSSRKTAILRGITAGISAEESQIAQNRKELEKIDQTQHKRMYENRVSRIQTSMKRIRAYRTLQRDVEGNDRYFSELESVASGLHILINRFPEVDQKEKILTEIQYQSVGLTPILVDCADNLDKYLTNHEDPYKGIVSGFERDMIALRRETQKVKKVNKPLLELHYCQDIENRSKYLQEKSKTLAGDVFSGIMDLMGIKREKNKKYSTYTFSPYLYLQILYNINGAPNSSWERLVMIDEAQNITVNELRLIGNVNKNQTVFNLFGDVGQHVEGSKGLDSWNEVSQMANFQIRTMNENYRNARQITEYCNRRFHMKMNAINLDGDGVHELNDASVLGETLYKLLKAPMKKGLSGILVKDRSEAEYVIQVVGSLANRIHDITDGGSILMQGKWNMLTIDQAKGIEFETVIAISGRMTKNEKYIAYTRALNELFVSDGLLVSGEIEGIDLNKAGDQSVAKESNPRAKNTDNVSKPVREKRVKRTIAEEQETAKPKSEKVIIVMNKQDSKTNSSEISVKQFFEQAGLKTVDLRKKNGCLWVIGSKEEIGDTVKAAVEKYGISGAYTQGKAIHYQMGWYTKTKK